MMPFMDLILSILVSSVLLLNCKSSFHESPRRDAGSEVTSFFYVGGKYENFTIYVEEYVPQNPTQPYPIIFIAGAGQTGTNWLTTPDGRPGWASFFLDHGYTVYLTDQTSRGRSPWYPGIGFMVASGTSDIETLFTSTSHNLWPQAHLHTQWPGTGKVGDPTFDAFYAAQVQLQADQPISEESNTKAHSALLDRIGPAYVLTHSQAGSYGWRIGDARPNLVKGIVALEPAGPPFDQKYPYTGRARPWGITIGEIEYEPSAGPNATDLDTVIIPAKDQDHTECVLQSEPPKLLKNLQAIPALVVGAEASFHAPYEYCTAEYLKQAGVDVEFADLGEQGIKGNGHMMFMEKNNLEIAEVVLTWIQKQ
uniref:Probable secreted lipase phiG n=1 Tax=Fungal sp. (strain ATCC 74256) TaxID=1729595 RepID=PHIG_FUNX7|nr:RecName: Full=Probable secreted lipase phiG; AltName: Full=Phomoidride biosynthesis cluster protein G; Flags: Precursor [fungal sp. ATCC 74256]BBG28504.1 putative hypothetical protein [fungal sp. ATCC 74256]